MSRRRGEFEHRTSIFEGAFRAWSHLGGLEPVDLESRPASELDPLTNPIENDPRLTGRKAIKQENTLNPNGSPRRQYPYEPLPRSGLAHPFVQAILSPWLGPDADNDAIQLGLTTLRTWWQHRRKGESGSAIAALGTEKMKGVVEGYTRHFFTLAHCLIVNDKEQPPRSLHTKMKELEKMRSKRSKKRNRDDVPGALASMPGMSGSMGGGIMGDPMAVGMTNDMQHSNLSPLEQLHFAQQKQLAANGVMQSHNDFGEDDFSSDDFSADGRVQPTLPIINVKNKCVPGKPDLPAIVDAVNHAANQLAHSGGMRGGEPSAVPSSVVSGSAASTYGDPDAIPIVFVSENGDAVIAMTVDGITCAHCVKIVETVLRGCNGNKSPIDGLLDAAADRALCAVLIRVDRVSNSKRIAFEAARNLAMVGYTAKAKAMSPTVEKNGKIVKMSLDDMFKAFQAVGHADPKDLFDWSSPCSCPDNGVARDDCARHGQMTNVVLDAFDQRGMAVLQFLSGHSHMPNGMMDPGQPLMMNEIQPLNDASGMGLDLFGGAGGMEQLAAHLGAGDMRPQQLAGGNAMRASRRERNPSIVSFGNLGNLRMSLTGRMSEVSYGRAMSGLSALSIDWENMEDFDINVDHSAHINTNNNNNINNNAFSAAAVAAANAMGGFDMEPKPMGSAGARRSSMRQPLMGGMGGVPDSDAHVSFKI
ncbi:hypothetical protein IV203_000733 [Nitzschia inconspicua]|uniref:HMA domain-containing protein n=1 Tax=Nitzschia inconspicua TaxID=303405 RepID=A0A9K3L611_9STRA|nr:hypothetical protein IV203_000733 [Nitzschia inconspicua]